MHFRESARAKVNLTLSVHGRRPDGYHEIESLVVFAEIGDRLTFSPGRECTVATSGPFAGDIEGRNLLETGLELLRSLDADLELGAVRLEKILPVAAGLGGGSADAAALLRAVRRANPERAGTVAWHDLATRLGADVPVCLAGVPALISGIGERLAPLDLARPLLSIACVLVNPRVPLSTAHVFRALAASSPSPHRSWRWGEGRGAAPGATAFADLEALLAYVRARGNDLEPPATSLLPIIADVKLALGAEPACRLAAMSGSGPTCFGLFTDDAAATRAAAALAAMHPRWWVAATRLSLG